MELEFDKEIDAILKRARGGTAVTFAGDHLDADVISSFAEGALPQAARSAYTRHLADCDRCRKLLSQAVTFNTATDAAPDGAVSSLSVPAGESASWISRLFRAPSLALAMGALVLTFSGVLGYLVLQNQKLDSAMISQTTNEAPQGGPYAGIDEQTANANAPSSAAAANIAANSAANSAARNSIAPFADATPADSARVDSGAAKSFDPLSVAERDAKGYVPDGVDEKPAAAAPAPKPPPPTDKTVADRDREKLEAKDDNVLLGGVRQETEDRRAAGTTLAKKKESGPTRSGPTQSQTQSNIQTYDMPVTRNAGGKKFTNRNGAWYDTAYRGQATTNIRRGTDEYRKLDGGLRSLADSLGGIIVVVWNGKAYRIQ